MQNSGNEAKEYLKTKDNHFLNAANCARFAHKLAQIGATGSQGVEELGSRSKRLDVGCRRFVTLRLSTLDFSNLPEQSENVIENKGPL
jgi:hypothetical protein